MKLTSSCFLGLFSVLSLGTVIPVIAHADTMSIDFAAQAGTIAGAAQACGQDVAVLNSRSGEAILLLANSEGERNQSVDTYQRSMQNAIHAQAASQKLACNQVLEDYRSLPILRDDYKQTVLAPLLNEQNKTSAPGNSPVAVAPAANAPATSGAAPTPAQNAAAPKAGLQAGPLLPSQAQAMTTQSAQTMNGQIQFNPALANATNNAANTVSQQENNDLVLRNNPSLQMNPNNASPNNNSAFQNNPTFQAPPSPAATVPPPQP